jgi:hypothetical protein
MEKKIKQHFATTYRRLTKKIMASIYRSIFLVHFTMLAPKAFTYRKIGHVIILL